MELPCLELQFVIDGLVSLETLGCLTVFGDRSVETLGAALSVVGAQPSCIQPNSTPGAKLARWSVHFCFLKSII